jgi:hypothetical protein
MLPDFPGNAAMTVFRQFIETRELPMPEIPRMSKEQLEMMLQSME